jgi:hypothetical protein
MEHGHTHVYFHGTWASPCSYLFSCDRAYSCPFSCNMGIAGVVTDMDMDTGRHMYMDMTIDMQISERN